MRKLLFSLLLGGLGVLAGCGGGGGGGGNTTVTLVSIQVTPATPSVVPGATQQFTATGSYSDGTTKNLTATANWLSSSPAVAAISTTGLATAVAGGTTTITATSGTVTGTTTLTVANPLTSIAVTPATATVNPTAPGNTQQFMAVGTFADHTTQDLTATATWQSTNSATATVNATGLATAVAPGSVTISATSGGVSGMATLTVANPVVSIAVTPANSSAAPGTKPLFVANGTLFDGTSVNLTADPNLMWSSSNTAVATISNSPGLQGQATAVAHGTTTITATYTQNGVQIPGSTTLTVTTATPTRIDVSPPSSAISLPNSQQFIALGTFSDGSQQDITNVATWTSSDTTKVRITVSGLATGVAITTTPVTITAAFKGISGTATVTVDAANLASIAIKPITPGGANLAQGTSRLYSATGTFTNGSTLTLTNQVIWTLSQSPTVATVGLHTGLVKALPLVPPSTMVTITATLGTVSQTSPLTVTNETPTSLTVTPIAAAIPVGITQDFQATATFHDGTTQDVTMDATWTSSNPSVATVGSFGRTSGVSTSPTPVTITASFDGQSNSGQLRVSNAILQSITVAPAQTILAPASTVGFFVTGLYNDGTTQFPSSATWTSSDTQVVTVTNSGFATGQQQGPAMITATVKQNGISFTSTAAVVVDPSPLVSITVTPASQSIPAGVSAQFTATGKFQDSSQQNLTTSANWASSSPSVATVSNAYPREGLATGVASGTTNITAVFFGAPNSPATLTVSTATLTSIAISPTTPTVTVGTPVSFTATGTFSDNSMIDLTNQANWGSSNVTVATINSAGQASTASKGMTTITVSFTQNGTTTKTTTLLTVN